MTIPIIGVKKSLTEAQQDCVDLLEETLAEARKGLVYSIGLVICLETGYTTVMGGPYASALNMGCDSLKKRILEAVEGQGGGRKQ